MPKCGHTAMWDYFGLHHLRMTRTLAYWLESQSPKVVVLRHPAQRMHASIAFYDRLWNSQIVEYQKTGIHDNLHDFKHFIDNPIDIEEYIFDQHCRPYMNTLKNRDFRINLESVFIKSSIKEEDKALNYYIMLENGKMECTSTNCYTQKITKIIYTKTR